MNPFPVYSDHSPRLSGEATQVELHVDREAKKVVKTLERIATTTDLRGVYRKDKDNIVNRFTTAEQDKLKEAGFEFGQWECQGEKRYVRGWRSPKRFNDAL